MLSKQLEEGFDSPQIQVEYAIFSLCSDVKSLCDDFDKEKCPEAFFTQQSCEALNLAAVRLSSIAAVISTRK